MLCYQAHAIGAVLLGGQLGLGHGPERGHSVQTRVDDPT
jgi:hypothetical protein